MRSAGGSSGSEGDCQWYRTSFDGLTLGRGVGAPWPQSRRRAIQLECGRSNSSFFLLGVTLLSSTSSQQPSGVGSFTRCTLMLRWERIDILPDRWDLLLEEFSDRTIFQSSSWLQFLGESTGGELVLAALRDGGQECGYSAGIVITRFGIRVLGSPLPGWTTSYMGFVLKPGAPRADALSALQRFAFEDLHCVHMELMDRRIQSHNLDSRYRIRDYKGFEIDLSLDENRLFFNLIPACRRCIRKASRCGVVIEEANDA